MPFSSKQIITLFKKDVVLEMRQQYTFYGVLLYVAATVFIIYLTNGEPESDTWNALFWIVQLFVAVNAVAKSFLQDSKGRMLYYYMVTAPINFIISKLLFNAVLMLLMSFVTLLVFLLLLGNPLVHFYEFLVISLFGSIGISLVFTFLAAIAAKAQQQASLMAIMGFPVIVPQLLLLSKISAIAFSDALQSGWWQLLLLLVCFDVLIIILAGILFPFLWRD